MAKLGVRIWTRLGMGSAPTMPTTIAGQLVLGNYRFNYPQQRLRLANGRRSLQLTGTR